MTTTKQQERRPIAAATTLVALFLILGLASCGGSKPGQPQATGSQPAAATGQPDTGTTAQTSPGTTTPSAQPASGQPAQAASTGTTQATTPAAPSAATGAGAEQPAPARKLGEIVFAEGSLTLHRAGGSPQKADIGTVVNAYDVLVTGPKSRAEVDLGAGSPGGASVKLAENTAFYFDTKELGDAQRKTVLQLLSGAVAIKVDKLANGSFQVGTDQAVLGVRGTVFIVDTVPDGSMLVTCESGAVAVSADGSTTTARPGAAVQKSGAGPLDTVAVEVSGLGAYRGSWRSDAYASFATHALEYTSSYAAALDAGTPAFNAALAKLQAQKAALDAWRAAKAAGKEPRFTDWIAEKKAVAGVLFDCLKALFSLERPYYRLMELKALHDAGTGVGNLKDGRSSAAYFKGFDTATKGLATGMAQVREALLLFSWASAGSPMGEFFGSKAASLGSGALLLQE